MSEKIVVKLIPEGVRQLLRCDELKAVINGHAQNMVNSLGSGYSFNNAYGSKDGRVRAFIHCDSDDAIKENLENNTLLTAVGNEHD